MENWQKIGRREDGPKHVKSLDRKPDRQTSFQSGNEIRPKTDQSIDFFLATLMIVRRFLLVSRLQWLFALDSRGPAVDIPEVHPQISARQEVL